MRLGLFGAAPDTGNLGVSALYTAFLSQLSSRLPFAEFTVFDNGRGIRDAKLVLESRSIRTRLVGVRVGHRYLRSENLRSMYFLSRVKWAHHFSATLAAIDECDVIMDVSGGDSFSDIYGSRRFDQVMLPKLICLRRKKPLVFLPQTYGPFRDAVHRVRAAKALAAADLAWARDSASFGEMKKLLGACYMPSKHRCGVDMAFGLQPQEPRIDLSSEISKWLSLDSPIVGVNVSGLIWNGGFEKSARDFGFRIDYRELLIEVLRWLLRETSHRIILIPHVQAPSGHIESDLDASHALLNCVADRTEYRKRVLIFDLPASAAEMKWVIARCMWFCGTRMHATIAALSSCVPTASIVYSDKAQGVFGLCGLPDGIVDPRSLSLSQALQALQMSLLEHESTRETLRCTLPTIDAALDVQMTELAEFTRAVTA